MNKLILSIVLSISTVLSPAFNAWGGSGPGGIADFDRIDSEAESLVKSGRADEAAVLLEKFVESIKAVSGPESPDLIVPGEYLAQIYLAEGEHEKAERVYIRDLKLLKSFLGDSHPKVAAYMNNLAIYYLARKELAKAEKFFVSALKIYSDLYGAEREEVVTARANLAELRKISQGSDSVKDGGGKITLKSKKKKAYHTGSFIAYPYRENGEMLLYDDAALLNESDKGEVINMLNEIRSGGGVVCFVIILKSMASYGVVGWDADVYAWNLLENWRIDGEPENRALLFVSVADHVVSLIGTGERFKTAKSRLDKIREDFILKNFKISKFSKGVLKGLEKLSVDVSSGMSE